MPQPPAPGPEGTRPPDDGPGPHPAGDLAIETRGLTKGYRGGQLAVDGLDLAPLTLTI